jgi:Mechanosensitive ion channel, conserved TM helix
MEQKPLESVRDVMTNIVGYLPTLLAGLIVLVLGGIVAWIVAKLVVRILIFLRLDRVIVRFGWGRALDKGDVRHSLFGLVGMVLGFLVFLVFLENAIVLWKLTVLSQLLERIIVLIPQLMVAALILLIGWAVAGAAARAAQRALYQEEFGRARFVARIVRAAILVVTCAIALVELDIAVTIVTGAFLITFGALALSFALAFGLGSRRAVESMWEQRLRPPKDEPGETSDPPDRK